MTTGNDSKIQLLTYSGAPMTIDRNRLLNLSPVVAEAVRRDPGLRTFDNVGFRFNEQYLPLFAAAVQNEGNAFQHRPTDVKAIAGIMHIAKVLGIKEFVEQGHSHIKEYLKTHPASATFVGEVFRLTPKMRNLHILLFEAAHCSNARSVNKLSLQQFCGSAGIGGDISFFTRLWRKLDEKLSKDHPFTGCAA